MAKANAEILRDWKLSHHAHKDWHTFYTLVTFRPGEKPHAFLNHLAKSYESLSDHVRSGNLRIWFASITFGAADAVIVWQVKNVDGWTRVAKGFRDAVLTGDPQTIFAMASDTHGRAL